MKPDREKLRQAALDYAARKLQVFPCIPLTKNPATPRGFYDAGTNPATVSRWWTARPYNIALRTGEASGVWVVDADPGKDGDVNLRKLETKHGPLPPTREVITVQGGQHYHFKYIGPIPCSVSTIAPGIDVRGDGGYVMLPPSVWENGCQYEWSVDSTDEPAIAPEWLVELARKKPIIPISERALAGIRRPYNGRSRYGDAALEDEIKELAATPPGKRNHALNRAAFSLFQLVAGGELDETEVFNRLVEAARANGLMTDRKDGPRAVVKTIQSGRRAGLQRPRSRPGAA